MTGALLLLLGVGIGVAIMSIMQIHRTPTLTEEHRDDNSR